MFCSKKVKMHDKQNMKYDLKWSLKNKGFNLGKWKVIFKGVQNQVQNFIN